MGRYIYLMLLFAVDKSLQRLFAHTPAEGSTAWHALRSHVLSVADKAESIGGKFGARKLCRSLGLAHDLAKADPRFQTYLRASHERRASEKCPHAAASASAVFTMLGASALAIVGHHSGLPDRADGKQRILHSDPQSVAAAKAFAETLAFPAKDEIEIELSSIQEHEQELFIRMAFGALVDSDFLDTEAHFNAGRPSLRSWPSDLAQIATLLKKSLATFDQAQGTVNRIRKEVLDACRQMAHKPQGAFRLTVPTGGGKTLSSLTFALDHAVRHKLDRVIVAIPYTSIIDQTADAYDAVLGPGVILEHHSAVEPEDDSENMSLRDYRRRLAAENWDAPVVVTTTVQLFESLFANRTSKCRRLHNIIRSVIVLDEIQTLPVELLAPTLDVLQQLISRYSVTVVFCTATQPDYSNLDAQLLADAQEIVLEPDKHFKALKRVDYRTLPKPVSHDELAALLSARCQALCILNSRRDAVDVARACGRKSPVFHLSTLMCPDHRRRVLKRVRENLDQGLPCLLVSTQVVEAGVDLDFPVVYRAMGPLDRIVQAAGRCNREGKLDRGQCFVFELEGGRQPRGTYRTGTDLARTATKEHLDDLDQPSVIAPYFRDLFGMTEHDAKNIQPQRRDLNYQMTANRYRLIEENTQNLVIIYYAEAIIRTLLDQAIHQPGREVHRRLQRYTVNVPDYEFEEFRKQGLVHQHESGLFVYTGPYDDLVGIGFGSEHDPTDLVR
jgi:CRISPR-associated endonuclease/helicase Cas3